MRGRADIEGSKSQVALNACRQQASYPCGNFSDTSVTLYSKDRKALLTHLNSGESVVREHLPIIQKLVSV